MTKQYEMQAAILHCVTAHFRLLP